MAEKSVSNANPASTKDLINALPQPERRANQMILIGAPAWVRGMIARFHRDRIAEAGSWSRPMPTGRPDEVISVLWRVRHGDR